MAYRNWLPSAWLGGKDEDHPLGTLRQQIDSVFEDFDKGFFGRAGAFAVNSNVSETDKEICITAELPGLTDADIDVSVAGNRLTIKGEKKSEKDEKGDKDGRQFRRIERYSGQFERIMSLPFDINPDTVEAHVKDGVLTVTLPKPPEAVAAVKKIPVKKAG